MADRLRPHLVAAPCLLPILALAGSAFAETTDQAAARLFVEGTSLFEAKRFEEGCAKFYESERLDPAIGTEFNVADCREREGKTASAWKLFKQVAERADAKRKTERADAARARAAALEPRLARVVITTGGAEATPGFEVTIDGAAFAADGFNRPTPIDPGDRVVDASAPSKAFHQTVHAVAGTSVELRIALVSVLPGGPVGPVASGAPVASTDQTAPSKMSTLRITGIALGGVGVAGLVVGAVTGGLSLSKHSAYTSAAQKTPGCVPSSCSNPTVVSDASAAVTLGNVSTGGFVAGGVFAAAGIGLIIAGKPAAAPAAALRLGPRSLGVEGSF